MIRTVSPTAASAVPRLMAVVVLPTPPFWLASARMRGAGDCGSNFSARDTMSLLHHEDNATGIGHARVAFNLHFPRFGGIGQFCIHILSLVKIANGAIFEEGCGIIEELGKGRKRSGRHGFSLDGLGFPFGFFAPDRVNMGAGSGKTSRFPQESRRLVVALEEMRLDGPGNGENESRYARPAAQVSESPDALRKKRKELQGISYVSYPDVLARRRADQVDTLLPLHEQA